MEETGWSLEAERGTAAGEVSKGQESRILQARPRAGVFILKERGPLEEIEQGSIFARN